MAHRSRNGDRLWHIRLGSCPSRTLPSQSLSSRYHSYQEDGDPREADVVEGDGPVVRVEPLGLARVEVLIPVDAVRL